MTYPAKLAAEKKLADLLVEQHEAIKAYEQHQTGDNYALILKLKQQVKRAKSEAAKF